MREFRGKTAVVTGAASGIGAALALRCADEGMAVVVADVDESGLEKTRSAAIERGARAIAVPTDVSQVAAVEALADAAESEFGKIHLVFNNAGVLVGGCAWELSAQDWEWVMGVNVFGVIHGTRVFLPRMIAHGESAQMVNTASVGGLTTGPWLTPYLVSKHAVAALSECLHFELTGRQTSVRISALCPGAVDTGIGESERIRPERHQAEAPAPGEEAHRIIDMLRSGIAAGMKPSEIADFTFAAIREERFWITPDMGFSEGVSKRVRNLLEGLDPDTP